MSGDHKPTVFISYSHKDEVWKDRLVSHLGVLSEQGHLTFWEDRQIGAGEDWYEKIHDAMNAANVAILLISAASLTSKFILSEEVKRLLQRRDSEGLIIFPVIVKSCPWQQVDWLSRMQVRPTDGKPLASYGGNRRDEALSNIATEIYARFKGAGAPSTSQTPRPSDASRINISRLPVTGRDLFGRNEQIKQLDAAWDGRETHVLSLVAWGGVGKSALVNHWLARMAREDYRGAERVYGWSFYSQGTTDRIVSADQFIEAALTWFGDPDPNKGSPWDKGERLAGLVAGRRSLLVLDGLEPLQHPPGADEGRLKDQALQSLLRGLAASNQGLCVISTRVHVADLSAFENSTAPRIDLEHLSPEAGAQLLAAQSVKGAEDELKKASEEFGGHSLALTLLGSYLADVYGGDVNRRGEVSDLESDARYGGHAQRVMVSYEKWFGEGPELAVLRLLGLFNRPADKGSIDALRAAPAIPGLTESLQGLSETNWQRTLSKLRRARLLSERSANQTDTLDTHPLVREHFGQQLKQSKPDAWREGNSRLYEHLRDTTEEFPDTLEEMAPLYAAIAHGCAAGRHQEALDKVYWRRIQRQSEFFSLKTLGAIGADTAALANFFDRSWDRPAEGISEKGRSLLLDQAGETLHTLGRLNEALKAMTALFDVAVRRENLKDAVKVAITLSELSLTMGNLTAATQYGKQSVDYADRRGGAFHRQVSRSTLADALNQSGEYDEAAKWFSEAEAIEQERRPEEPLLSSMQGYAYCEFLFGKGAYREIEDRATRTLQWAEKDNSLLAIALDHLSLGRANLLRARQEATGDLAEATNYLKLAVNGLRQAGTLHLLPRGLLASAELYRIAGELDRAQTDLDEAMSVATRSKMGLYEADCHLEYARLYLARGEKEKARASWEKAREMIVRMGYGRRDKDVREIDEQLTAAAGA